MNGCGCATRRPCLNPPRDRDCATVQKDYRRLRPLRVRALDLHEGESIALLGFDRAAAEVLVNLITAATFPMRVRFASSAGRPLRSGCRSWLTSLDSFGIVSERASCSTT
jgi:hypothetical protein